MSDEPTEINENGTKIWRNSQGKKHRSEDKPAVICINGDCFWLRNGYYHRDNNLPAIIWPDIYTCKWYQNGIKIKEKQCTKEEIEEYKRPYYQQKKFVKFNRFEKLIK